MSRPTTQSRGQDPGTRRHGEDGDRIIQVILKIGNQNPLYVRVRIRKPKSVLSLKIRTNCILLGNLRTLHIYWTVDPSPTFSSETLLSERKILWCNKKKDRSDNDRTKDWEESTGRHGPVPRYTSLPIYQKGHSREYSSILRCVPTHSGHVLLSPIDLLSPVLFDILNRSVTC